MTDKISLSDKKGNLDIIFDSVVDGFCYHGSHVAKHVAKVHSKQETFVVSKLFQQKEAKWKLIHHFTNVVQGLLFKSHVHMYHVTLGRQIIGHRYV